MSPTRSAGIAFTFTFGDPMLAGPMQVCGQAGHPWASAGTWALFPMDESPGIA
jgi:hypothetical protein